MADQKKQAESPEDENKAALAYYALAREKVEHEDGLVNQRLGWMLLLQGFLFSAYGFSMSAEGASLSSRAYEAKPTAAALHARDVFAHNLANLRQGLVLVGMLSALIALAGVLAAFRAIRDDEAELSNFPRKDMKGRSLFPNIIGARSTNVLGMFCGLGMPFLVFGAWMIVGRFHMLVAGGVLTLAALSTLLYVFFKLTSR